MVRNFSASPFLVWYTRMRQDVNEDCQEVSTLVYSSLNFSLIYKLAQIDAIMSVVGRDRIHFVCSSRCWLMETVSLSRRNNISKLLHFLFIFSMGGWADWFTVMESIKWLVLMGLVFKFEPRSGKAIHSVLENVNWSNLWEIPFADPGETCGIWNNNRRRISAKTDKGDQVCSWSGLVSGFALDWDQKLDQKLLRLRMNGYLHVLQLYHTSLKTQLCTPWQFIGGHRRSCCIFRFEEKVRCSSWWTASVCQAVQAGNKYHF